MRSERALVVQHLVVERVRAVGRAVHVEVVGRLGARDEVRFSFEDQRSASDQAWTVECWRRAGTRLTYVHLDGQGILLDDASWFAGAIGAGPHQAR